MFGAQESETKNRSKNELSCITCYSRVTLRKHTIQTVSSVSLARY